MRTCKIILIKDLKNLGRKNDVVEVNLGYAENYLIPNKIGIKYSIFSANKLKSEIDAKANEKKSFLNKEQEIKQQLEKDFLIIYLKSHNNKAIGGVNPSFLAKEIFNQFGLTISKNAFQSTASISSFGTFTRGIKLPHGTICALKINILEEIHG